MLKQARSPTEDGGNNDKWEEERNGLQDPLKV